MYQAAYEQRFAPDYGIFFMPSQNEYYYDQDEEDENCYDTEDGYRYHAGSHQVTPDNRKLWEDFLAS